MPRSVSGPTPFRYDYRLSPGGGETDVQLAATFATHGVAALLGPLAGRAVKRGAYDNLAALKRILEAGAVRRRARPVC